MIVSFRSPALKTPAMKRQIALKNPEKNPSISETIFFSTRLYR